MFLDRSFFIDFFVLAEQRLDGLTLDKSASSWSSVPSVSDVRQLLLSTQMDCLDACVGHYNASVAKEAPHVTVDEARMRLQELGSGRETLPVSVKDAMDRMNEAARRALARLILHAECLHDSGSDKDKKKRDLKSSGSIIRSDLIEFIGLCNVAVRLSNVQAHLCSGAPLFPGLPIQGGDPIPFFPQQRLEVIQRCFLRALGYDDDFGSSELKRIMIGSNSILTQDQELGALFASMGATMNAAVQNATMKAMHASLSDKDQGGCTKVVGVEYSERIVDASTGEVIATSSNQPSSMIAPQSVSCTFNRLAECHDDSVSSESPSHWQMAKQASRLHQEILGELLSMEPEERQNKLDQAKQASKSFLEKLHTLNPGVERVAFLESLEMSTQRLLIMEKLWTSMLQANGGKPPTMNRIDVGDDL